MPRSISLRCAVLSLAAVTIALALEAPEHTAHIQPPPPQGGEWEEEDGQLLCEKPLLPHSWNGPEFLGIYNEFHVHQTYAFNPNTDTHDIEFTLEHESVCRILVAPPDPDDDDPVVDAFIYKVEGSNQEPVPYGFSAPTEGYLREQILVTLAPAHYRFVLKNLNADDTENACPQVTMEVAIAPTDVFHSRTGLAGGTEEKFPDLPLADIANGHSQRVRFDEAGPFFLHSPSPSSEEIAYQSRKEYKLELPILAGSHSHWELDIAIRYDFLMAGSIGMMIYPEDTPPHSPLECQQDHECTFAQNLWSKNERTIRTVATAGHYILQIYERVDKRHDVPFLPFSFRFNVQRATEPETFISCEATEIPTTFNAAGYLHGGWMHYWDKVFLDMSYVDHPISFTIHEPSLIRAYVSEHRAEVILRLEGHDHDHIADAGLTEEKSLLKEIPAGDYTLVVEPHESFEPAIHCPTIVLEVAIAPISKLLPFPGFCHDETGSSLAEKTPNFDDMHSLIDRAIVYNYAHTHRDSWAPAEVFRHEFVVEQRSRLRVEVGVSFLLGDLNVRVENLDKEHPIKGDHVRDASYLHTTLYPGHYNLIISTPQLQTPDPAKTDLESIPVCLPYSFTFTLKPTHEDHHKEKTDIKCADVFHLPYSLFTPQYLRSSSHVHIQEDTVVPQGEAFQQTHKVYVSVKEASLLRVYTEPHHTDVDLELRVGEQAVAESKRNDGTYNWNPDEVIISVLEPGKDYHIAFNFYDWEQDHIHEECQTFDLELAIAPISSKTPIEHCEPKTPDLASIHNNLSENPHEVLTVTFVQGSASHLLSIPLKVTEYGTSFRATVHKDFLWNDVSIRLMEGGTQSRHGFNHFNRQEISSTFLPIGEYTLEIYEREPMVEAHRTCATYTVEFEGHHKEHMPSVKEHVETWDFQDCPKAMMPKTFDMPGFLSRMSGNQMLFTQWFHAEANGMTSNHGVTHRTEFTIAEDSVFRLHVPEHPSIDVEASLHTSHGEGGSLGEQLAGAQHSMLLESFQVVLHPGKYALEITAHDLADYYEPCVTFELMVAVSPLARMKASPKLSAQCQDHLPPAMVTDFPSRHAESWTHGITATSFVHHIDVHLEKQSYVYFQAGFDSYSAPLMVTIADKSNPDEWAPALIGENQHFIEAVLPYGEYTLTIEDISESVLHMDQVICQPFSTVLVVEPFDRIIHNEYDECSFLSHVPTDLSTKHGGSFSHGGPQNDHDGSFRLYGEEFRVPMDRDYDTIEFHVKQPSLFRLYMNIDADVTLLHDDEELMMYEAGEEEAPSPLVHLGHDAHNLDHPFHILINYLDRSAAHECQPFHLEVVMETVTEVESQVKCHQHDDGSGEMQPLPKKISLGGKSMSDCHFPDELCVTLHEMWDSDHVMHPHHRQPTFEKLDIPLQVHDKMTVMIAVGYDLLLSSFQMAITDAEGDEIAFGKMELELELDKDAWVNFASVIEVGLEPGMYNLHILEDPENEILELSSDECIPFSFHASFLPSDYHDPSMEFLDPEPGEYILDDDFELDLEFSEEVSSPFEFITDEERSVVILKAQDGSHVIPHRLHWLYPEVLQATWLKSQLTLHVEYELSVQIEHFKTWEDTSFVNRHQYKTTYKFFAEGEHEHPAAGAGEPHHDTATPTPDTHHLEPTHTGTDQSHYDSPSHTSTPVQTGSGSVNLGECSGHGHKQDGHCVCYDGYHGEECLDCAEGFHHTGHTCIRNVKCEEHTCNGHGTCHDDEGYPICHCEQGWATHGHDFCKVCAPGYAGEHCAKAKVTARKDDRVPANCDAQQLPTTLDSPAYLNWDETVHMQGKFYMDLAQQLHVIDFTVLMSSVFRVHVGHANYDVDLSLAEIDGTTGTVEHQVAHGLTEAIDESIVELLEPNNNGRYYQLTIRYYETPQSAGLGELCHSFFMELEIMPQTIALSQAREINAHCHGQNNLPQLSHDGHIEVKSSNGGYVFNGMNEIYTYTSPEGVSSEANHYFSPIMFAITSGGGGHLLPRLVATLHYRFALGDLAFMIVPGMSTNPPVGEACREGKICYHGINIEANQNHLDLILPPGEYTLWLYEPLPLKKALGVNCAVFQMELQIKYDTPRETKFNCDGARLPYTLNSPGFLDARGYMHVNDDFFVDLVAPDSAHVMRFEVKEESEVRLFIPSHFVNFDVRLQKNHPNDYTELHHLDLESETLMGVVPAGSYALVFRFFPPDWIDPTNTQLFCETFTMELGIAPVKDVPPSPLCSDTEQGNQLHNPKVAHFEKWRQYQPEWETYHSNHGGHKDALATLSLPIEHGTNVVVEVNHDFMQAHVVPVIVDTSTQHRYTAFHFKNYNRIVAYLEPGEYVVTVYQEGPIHDHRYPCAVFDVAVSTVAETTYDQACLSPHLPTSLNNHRFLGVEERFYDRGIYTVHLPEHHEHLTADVSHSIEFTVSKPSHFRVFVDPHVVDIDLELQVEKDGQWKMLVSEEGSQEESIIQMLEPNNKYSLGIHIYDHDMEFTGECVDFSMEIGIEPFGDLHPQNIVGCRNGGDHGPPHIPRGVSKWSYDSVKQHETLYLQQRAKQKRKTIIPLSIHGPSQIHAQVGFEFQQQKLMLVLKDYLGGVHQKSDSYDNVAVLTVPYIEPGNYLLEIYEPKENPLPIMQCIFYSFSLDIVPDDSREPQPLGIRPPPITLDTLAGLKLVPHVHIANDYLMPSHQKKAKVTFTVKEKSILRLYVTPHSSSPIEVSLHSHVAGDSLGALVGEGRPDVRIDSIEKFLFHRVEPGEYDIVLDFTNAFHGAGDHVRSHLPVLPRHAEAMTFNMEFAIAPEAVVVESLKTHDLAHCPDEQLPHPKLSPRGFYEAYLDGVMSPTRQTQQEEVQRLDFTFERDTSIEATLGSQFLVGDLMIFVNSTDPRWRPLVSTNRGNLDILDAVVPPGSYEMYIYQPVTLDPALSHCMRFSFHIQVQDARSHLLKQRCYARSTLPWDLNSADGGSAIYGGPIDSHGRLRFYDDFFVMPKSAYDEFDTITFTLHQKSIFRVFAKLNSRTSELILNVMQTGSGVQHIRPLHHYSTMGDAPSPEESQLYYLQPHGAEETYELELHYSHVDEEEPCAYFELQVEILPFTELENKFVCEDPLPSHLIPEREIHLDGNGQASIEVESVLPEYQMLPYKISFELTKDSSFDIQIAFNSLVNWYSVKLNRHVEHGEEFVDKSEVIALGHDWFVDMDSVAQLTQKLKPGHYSFHIQTWHIREHGLDHEHRWGDFKNCFPFVYAVEIHPLQADVTLIAAVEPPSGHKILHGHDLHLDLEFQSELYLKNTQGGANQMVDDGNEVLHAFSLQPGPIVPTLAGFIDGNFGAPILRITFSGSQLNPGTEYTLHVNEGEVLDWQGHSHVLYGKHAYGVVSTCNGHGKMGDWGCECDHGYGGDDCDSCGVGFERAGDHSTFTCIPKAHHDPPHHQPINHHEGGQHHQPPAHPFPINHHGLCAAEPGVCHHGRCEDHTGHIICHCEHGWQGPRCDMLLHTQDWGDVNAQHNPTHQKNCEYPCVNGGTCDYNTGTCICRSPFTGERCAECEPGYEGTADCIPQETGIYTFARLMGILVGFTLMGLAIVISIARWRRSNDTFTFSRVPGASANTPGLDDDDNDVSAVQRRRMYAQRRSKYEGGKKKKRDSDEEAGEGSSLLG